MNISLRLNESDSKLIRSYAELNGLSLSELFRQAVLERIEDEYDLKAFDAAYAKYLKDGKTYTHEEALKLLEL